MRQSFDRFIATYPLTSGGNRLVQVCGAALWDFGRFESPGRCTEMATTIFPRLRLFRLPIQSHELDVDALRILVSTHIVHDVSIAA